MATYRDQQLECSSCGKFFFFTVTDQHRLYQEGEEVVAPTLCPPCRHRDPTTGKQQSQVK